MELNAYEVAVIAGGFTVLGTLLGALIGYRNAINLYKVTEFNKAATRFRSAFYPDVLFFKYGIGSPKTTSPDQSLDHFLQYSFLNRHAEALMLFRAYLSTRQIANIEKDWQSYQEKIKKCTSNPMNQEEKNLALNLLETFLDKHAPLL
ncbi:MAG: hypothetical protein D3909_18920 [Candidatus Electrothrix sp. ATG1]|nr:hypothetical protein [Candidatus Electrothrix sp. ATG1]